MPVRINGFSGMDIDGLVKQLMTAKRVPLDKLNQQKTVLQWQRDSYREMNSKIFDFRTNKLTDRFNRASAMNTWNASVSGDTDAIKAEATANATGVPMTVKVVTVATKTTITSNAQLVADGEDKVVKLSTTLGALNGYDKSKSPETFKLTINKAELSFSSTDTISSVISKINSSNANVTASFDEVSGKLSFIAKEYGSKADITVKEDDYKPADSVKMLDLLHINLNEKKEGKGSEIEVTTAAGNQTFTSDTSNTFTVNGVILTALKVTSGNPSVITTKTDPTKAVDTLKAFVQSYNDLISLLNDKVGEEKYRNFLPLTDEQKANMKESEITAWEAKAKSGLLKNDDILKDTITAMRSIITNNMGNLSVIGITTGSYSDGGKINLDEDKLKVALQNNPQQVTDLFQGTVTSPKSGIFSKVSDAMTSTLQKFSDRAGTNRFSGDLSSAFKDESVMGKQMKGYSSRISDLMKRLDDAETRYYKQFSAMETAMSKLQSQSASLFGKSSS